MTVNNIATSSVLSSNDIETTNTAEIEQSLTKLFQDKKWNSSRRILVDFFMVHKPTKLTVTNQSQKFQLTYSEEDSLRLDYSLFLVPVIKGHLKTAQTISATIIKNDLITLPTNGDKANGETIQFDPGSFLLQVTSGLAKIGLRKNQETPANRDEVGHIPDSFRITAVENKKGREDWVNLHLTGKWKWKDKVTKEITETELTYSGDFFQDTIKGLLQNNKRWASLERLEGLSPVKQACVNAYLQSKILRVKKHIQSLSTEDQKLLNAKITAISTWKPQLIAESKLKNFSKEFLDNFSTLIIQNLALASFPKQTKSNFLSESLLKDILKSDETAFSRKIQKIVENHEFLYLHYSSIQAKMLYQKIGAFVLDYFVFFIPRNIAIALIFTWNHLVRSRQTSSSSSALIQNSNADIVLALLDKTELEQMIGRLVGEEGQNILDPLTEACSCLSPLAIDIINDHFKEKTDQLTKKTEQLDKDISELRKIKGGGLIVGKINGRYKASITLIKDKLLPEPLINWVHHIARTLACSVCTPLPSLQTGNLHENIQYTEDQHVAQSGQKSVKLDNQEVRSFLANSLSLQNIPAKPLENKESLRKAICAIIEDNNPKLINPLAEACSFLLPQSSAKPDVAIVVNS